MEHLTYRGLKLYFMAILIAISTKMAISAGLCPEGQDISYLYELSVTTKTEKPALFESQFNLTGRIHIQCVEEHIIVQSKELQFSMFSGDSVKKENVITSKLPDEAVFLTKPFTIHLQHGKVSHLEVSSAEPVWSRSIKQGWASLFQLDLLKIDVNQANSFASLEDSIHGECSVKYTIQPKANNQASIVKFKSSSDCQSEPMFWSNIEGTQCSNDEPRSYKLFSRSEQKYEVSKDDVVGLSVKSIEAFGETFIFVTENSQNMHSITVSQKLTMQSSDKITQTIQMPASEVQHKIKSLKFDENEFFSFKFSTNEDLSKVVKKVVQLAVLIVSQLEGPDQLTARANPQQPALIPLLITYLRKLDVDLLHVALTEVKKLAVSPAEQLLIKILPLVGSRESSLFILSLIGKKQIDDVTAVFLLSTMPINIRQTSEDLLIDLEELSSLPEGVTQLVKETAVLSFGTLLYRTCNTNKCSEKAIHKYTTQYIDAMNEYSDDFGKKITYLTGFGNMRSLPSVKYLIPFVTEKEKISEDFRIQVIKTVGIIISNDPEQAYNVFWPVIYEKNNSLEIKRAALDSLLKSKPNKSLLLQLQRLMETENDPHVYSLYFSTLKAFSVNEKGCNSTSYNNVQDVIKMSQTPEISASTSFHQTFSIFGDVVSLLGFINTKSGLVDTFLVHFTSKSIGYKVNLYTVYLKVRGLKEEHVKVIDEQLPEEVRSTLVKLIPFSSNYEPLHIELILYSQSQAILTRYYDENNIHRLVKDLNLFIRCFKETNLSFLHVTSVYNLEKFFVTDVGLPGVLSIDLPVMTSVEAKNGNDFATFKLRRWSQGTTVLKVKNSFVSIWQGIMKSQLSRANLPLNFKSTTELANPDINVVQFTNPEDDAEIGFKWQTNTNLFTVTYDEHYDALSVSCEQCKNSVTVAKEKPINEDLLNLNFKYHYLCLSGFDCENDGSMSQIMSEVQQYSKNTFTILGLIPSAWSHLQNSLARLPISGSCGFVAVLAPNNKEPQPKVCFGLKHIVDHQSSYKYSNREYVLLYDTTHEEMCPFESKSSITLKVEEVVNITASEVNEEECDFNTDVNKWSCLKPVIMSCFTSINEEPDVKKDLKLEMKLPVGTSLEDFMDEREPTPGLENTAINVYFEEDSIYFKLGQCTETTHLSRDPQVVRFVKRFLAGIF